MHPNLPPISLYTSRPAAVVPTPVYQAAVGSYYPRLPGTVFQQSGTEAVAFPANFLRNQ